jgi:hypothetical protein
MEGDDVSPTFHICINCFSGFGKTLVNSAPAGRGGLPLAAIALLGSYEEAPSTDVDEDNTGCMTQNGLMGGGGGTQEMAI